MTSEHDHDRRHIPAQPVRRRSTRRSPVRSRRTTAGSTPTAACNGRTITDIVHDDQYNPSKTSGQGEEARRDGSGLRDRRQPRDCARRSPRGTTSTSKKVPQVLLATGDSYWGTCMASGAFKPQPYCKKPKPWTMGWQPDYPGEAKIYAKYILAHKPEREDRDPVPGRRLRPELPRRVQEGASAASTGHQIVDARVVHRRRQRRTSWPPTSVRSRRDGADTRRAVLDAEPRRSARSSRWAALHWTPLTCTSTTSRRTGCFMLSAEAHGANARTA